ncbi:MAG TPA: hypothetical protein PKE69_15350 [Pyrinomonadaceae bacterium]|nr:hypothetical protein [Pyrinomonadaceae bacterium]
MCVVGFIKRIAPFALALSLGLFVASFFVTVAAPSFKRGKFNKHREYHRQQEFEIRQLRIEKSRLEEELRQEKIKNQSSYSHDWEHRELRLIRESDNFQPRIENQDIQQGKKK